MTSHAWGSTYNPQTTAGIWVDQGVQGITDFANKYKDNETIGNIAAGSYLDIYRTQANTGMALGYNMAMSSHLQGLQQANENLRTANSLKLMGAEGRIAKDLIGAQGEQQRMGIRETGAQQRLNIGAQGTQDRLNIGAQGAQDRLNIAATGTEQRAGMRTKGKEDRLTVAAAGAQERLNIGKRYQEERNMRADARGAIRSTGARFYG
tara:strand:- start:1842 stop:2462 length:621 start_codon:yes stop_codon:yes gene_type:complete